MEAKDLKTLLEQLHNEIENTESIDDTGRELLREIGSDIRDLLARSEEGQIQQHSLLGRLQESISYLEVTHPTLTNTIARVMESLSNAGI